MTDSNRPKLIFRVDGSAQIGLGHIMRCLAIAEMTADLFSLSVAIQQPSDAVRNLFQQAAFRIITLPETSNYVTDSQNLIGHLTGSEFVLLDGYRFEAAYQKAIKHHCRKLLVIDDLIAWRQHADVVINHGGNVQPTDYQSEHYTQFLTGTSYALLRKPFLEAGRNKYPVRLTTFFPKRILVNLGGADPENISLQVIESLFNELSVQQVTVVLGSANLHANSFVHYDRHRVQIRRNLSAEQLIDEIYDCDIAIVSCSTISYEIATIGKPFIGILTADNQSGLRTFYKANQIALAVLEKNFSAAQLSAALSTPLSLVNESLTGQHHFFDGRSGDRLVAFFRTLLQN